MWLAFMDEAGNTGRRLDDADQPLHVIVSLLVPEDAIATVHVYMRSLAQRWFPDIWDNDAFEFHGAEIFSGEGYFDGWTPAERVTVYEEILGAIQLYGLRAIVRGVHKPRLAVRYANPFHPHDIALMFSLEEIERFARRNEALTQQDCRVLVIADENRENEDSALRDLANYQMFGTGWGWNPIAIDHVVDTIHFVRSETNWAIQLTDCAAYVAARRARIFRRMTDPETRGNQKIQELWQRLIAPHLETLNIWEP